jgi:hypothetical protein
MGSAFHDGYSTFTRFAQVLLRLDAAPGENNVGTCNNLRGCEIRRWIKHVVMIVEDERDVQLFAYRQQICRIITKLRGQKGLANKASSAMK